jgi:hypothetical protein
MMDHQDVINFIKSAMSSKCCKCFNGPNSLRAETLLELKICKARATFYLSKLDGCRGVEPPPPFRTRTTPAWVNDKDLRRQYRDGLKVEQSESQVRSHFTQHLEYGRTVQRIV